MIVVRSVSGATPAGRGYELPDLGKRIYDKEVNDVLST